MSDVIIRTSLVFVFTFLVIRVLGKKRLSQLGVIDLLLIISLGSAVGDVMIYGEDVVSLAKAAVAITTVAVLIKIIDRLVLLTPKLEKVIEGQPAVLISHGRINKSILAKENLTEEKVKSLIREQGFDSFKEIKYAILEPDGKLSVIGTHQANLPC